MKFEIPDALPVLARGNHEPGSGKACIMDAISIISGKPKEQDQPSCVHPTLRALFIRVNDTLPGGVRHKLWPLGLRAMGTGDVFAEDGDSGQLVVTVYLKMSQAAYRRASDEPPTVEKHTAGRLLPYVLDCLHEPTRAKRTRLSRAVRAMPSASCVCDGCEFLWCAAAVVRTTVLPSFMLLDTRMDSTTNPETKLQLLEWLMDGFEAATEPSSEPAPVIDWDELLRELGTVKVTG